MLRRTRCASSELIKRPVKATVIMWADRNTDAGWFSRPAHNQRDKTTAKSQNKPTTKASGEQTTGGALQRKEQNIRPQGNTCYLFINTSETTKRVLFSHVTPLEMLIIQLYDFANTRWRFFTCYFLPLITMSRSNNYKHSNACKNQKFHCQGLKLTTGKQSLTNNNVNWSHT